MTGFDSRPELAAVMLLSAASGSLRPDLWTCVLHSLRDLSMPTETMAKEGSLLEEGGLVVPTTVGADDWP